MLSPEVVALGVAAVMGLWILGAHNRLVRLRQAVNAAYAPIDELLRRRHALLAELIEASTPQLADQAEAIAAVDAARLQARAAADHAAQRPAHADRLASLVLAEQVLRSASSRLVALVKARAALRADARVREVMASLSTTQHRLSAARHAFKATVLDYNRNAQQFPTRFVAAMFGFRDAGSL